MCGQARTGERRGAEVASGTLPVTSSRGSDLDDAHEPAVAGYIGGQDGRELAFDTLG